MLAHILWSGENGNMIDEREKGHVNEIVVTRGKKVGHKKQYMIRLYFSILMLLSFIKLFAQTDSILYQEATAFYKMEKFKEASVLYQKVIGINSKYQKAYDRFGACLENQKKIKKALVFYENHIKKDSLYSPIYLSIGRVYFNNYKSKKEIALNYFNKAIEIDSTYAVALYYLGCYYSEKKDQALNSEKYFFKSLIYSRCEQFKACIYEELGSIYYNRKLYEKAIEYLSKSIEIDKGQPLPYITRSLCYDNLNEIEKSNADYSMFKKTKKVTKKNYVVYDCE